MGTPLKHKKSLLDEWPEGAEEIVPAQSARAAGFGAGVSREKPVSRRARLPIRGTQTPEPDAALLREPAMPAKAAERRSQSTSPEHLRKLQRLPNLRAPYPPKTGRPAPGMRG
jgi:hypothetical protein